MAALLMIFQRSFNIEVQFDPKIHHSTTKTPHIAMLPWPVTILSIVLLIQFFKLVPCKLKTEML
jgi:hypothetical protein